MIQNLLIKTAQAAVDITPTEVEGTSTVSDLITRLVPIIGGIAGAIAFIYLIYSGILYLTAAGNPDNAKKGQQGIINAIIGIIVIVAAWTIISVVTGTANTATQ